ncbi:MAG: asparagine synthase (glutamine-hydrolyzing) [Candidatus Lernaella stagnicola]|nr:asparagine synthase (glutamine-hydrolyzing) [Candidatus Lernaella stagnicola]
MCGIAAIWGRGDIEPMTRMLAHRGPDEEGFYRDGPVQLGSRRLKVIDLVTGTQPIQSPDGKFVIVYNGEVFNYKELRAELESEYEFRTQTDTEVILNAYRKWGKDCVTRFNGQFAFVIYDGERFFCARDRLGEKPFYWAHNEHGFYVASEIKALLTQIESAPRITEAFWVFDAPLAPDTIFEGVCELGHGRTLTYDGHEVTIESYWESPRPDGDDDRSDDELVEELAALIEDAVRIRMVADVPVGLFLSGGLDSSIMAAVARPSQVFSCRFPLGVAFDEFEHAKTMADHIGAAQHVVTPKPEDLQTELENIIWHLDQPIATASTISEFALARTAANHVTVVLGGQGADEIFAGYVRYLLMQVEHELGRRTELKAYHPLARFFWRHDMFGDVVGRYFHLIHRAQVADPTAHIDRIRAFFQAGRSLPDCLGLTDLHISLPSLIQMNDRAAAAFGLENRCPFLDHRIVEFAFRLPPHLKIHDLTTKVILRRAATRWVPDSIVNRKDKKGLVVPIDRWLNGPLKTWANELIGSLESRGLDIPPPTPRGEFDRSRYTKACLELWFRRFFPGWHA